MPQTPGLKGSPTFPHERVRSLEAFLEFEGLAFMRMPWATARCLCLPVLQHQSLSPLTFFENLVISLFACL